MDLERYSRQMLLPVIGTEGQRAISAATVVVTGCGALGTVAANLLARAGVGRLRIIDRDFIEASNLQRQMLFDEQDCRDHLPKAVAAERKLRQINSQIQVEGLTCDLNPANAEELLQDATVVVDGTDNFETRYLINDVCVKQGRPWVYGGGVGTSGVTMTIIPGETPCLRCVFESMPAPGTAATCETAGVLGALTSVIGSMQACEALKICTGQRGTVNRKLVSIDLWSSELRAISLSKAAEADCPACKQRRFDFLEGQQISNAASLCGRNSVQVNPRRGLRLNLAEVAGRLKSGGGITPSALNPYLLKFSVPGGAAGLEVTVFPDARAIVQGTKDVTEARSVYTRYIGL